MHRRRTLLTVLSVVIGLLAAPAAVARPPADRPGPDRPGRPTAPRPVHSHAGRPVVSGELRALTYNVAGLPEGLSGSNPSVNSPLISPLLNAFDLVLLQEDWEDPLLQAGAPTNPNPTGYHHLIVSEVDHPWRSVPGRHPWGTDLRRVPRGHSPPLIADGLNRLARFPFDPLVERVAWEECHGELAVEVVEAVSDAVLDGAEAIPGVAEAVRVLRDSGLLRAIDGGSADCGAAKGFSFARMTLAPGVEVDVYNLHADAGGSGAATRAHNFDQLAAFIAERSAGRAVILGGDTNLRTGGPDARADDVETWRRFLTATGLRDVCDVADCGAGDGEIDKFAFRGTRRIRLTPVSAAFLAEQFTRSDGEPLSDHDPLAVTFRWKAVPVRS